MTVAAISLDEYRQRIGTTIGTSRWFSLDQQRIDTFAKVTEDEQFIHVDPAAAAQTPFGGTIAHGFLSLSMLSAMVASAVPPIAGTQMGINYGLNSVRFVKPVASGQKVRGVFVLKDVAERNPGQWQSTLGVSVEIEGEDKPTLVAEWLILAVVEPVAA
ncbi:MaoC family dehydratase [Sphingobium subterraneum]|uniref:Acyl dehydratase n=1 Tax=Sphingobium subterraneum TaxID=627688 RepID=A0A841J2T8_9SPHN|nr:MaoC family dehydratase [Sphingobium subterraneum]MBB6125054.1 acyl dehydratase [Sphingobium subterraneum]